MERMQEMTVDETITRLMELHDQGYGKEVLNLPVPTSSRFWFENPRVFLGTTEASRIDFHNGGRLTIA
jgi:hypothetical protein